MGNKDQSKPANQSRQTRPTFQFGAKETLPYRMTVPAKYTFNIGSGNNDNQVLSAYVPAWAEATISKGENGQWYATLKILNVYFWPSHPDKERYEKGSVLTFSTKEEAIQWCNDHAGACAKEVLTAAQFVYNAVTGNYSEVGTPLEVSDVQQTAAP